ncbi:cytochrome-c peroxidase [Chloroflexota bacterium]
MRQRIHVFILQSLLAAIAAGVVGCGSAPDVPDYYAPQVVTPDRGQILAVTPLPNADWTPAEIAMLTDLWLGSLPAVPPSPSNAVADNPQAAALGHKLFFDARLSANNQVACTTCHRPDLIFTDGFPVSFGTRTTKRNAPTLIGAAYSPWLLWDGHKDSLWAQALEPIEHPDEQGSTRLHAAHLIQQDKAYRTRYEAVFGPLPPELADFDRFPDSGGPVQHAGYRANWESMTLADQAIVTQIYVNLGQAIAAYERLILPGRSRFDTYVQAVLERNVEMAKNTLSPDEVAGLRLFIGQSNCIRCHSGPLFTDNNFHNNGVPMAEGLPPDDGRATGGQRVLTDEFNCLGPYSDAEQTECIPLNTAQAGAVEVVYAFRPPTLRNVAETAPYMHAGQIETLREVLEHYNQAPPAPMGQTEVQPLNLSETELDQLEAFLRSLSAPLASPPELLKTPTK